MSGTLAQERASAGAAAVRWQTDTMRRMLGDELQTRRRHLEVGDDSSFLSLWQETLAWLASTDRAGFDELLHGCHGERYRAILAPCQRRYLTLLENAVAERLFALDPHEEAALAQLLDIPFARQAYERVAEAFELVDFSRCRLVVNIGCGPFPAAALLIHQRTTVPRIVAIDNDAVAVALASRVIRRLASPRLEVGHGDGTTYDFSSADVIYVANHVVPKAQVMSRIAETASSDARVLVREPCGLGLVLAERGCDPPPAPLQLLQEGADDANFHSKHVLCALGSDSTAGARLVGPTT